MLLAAVFYCLIISKLENKLKIYLKKFAESKKALYICIVKQLKQNKMNTYKITFVTLDGNTNAVYIDATSKERAILKFESEYQYEAIKYCEEED